MLDVMTLLIILVVVGVNVFFLLWLGGVVWLADVWVPCLQLWASMCFCLCKPKDVHAMTGPRKRCRRLNEAGHAHALTFSCFRRQPFLSKDRSRHWMIEAIDKARIEHRFHLWAYVVMPEHVHLLICPTEADYSISAILKTMKQFVSRKAIHFLQHNAPEFLPHLLDRQPNGRSSYRFWQRGGGYDRNLTEPKTIWAVMEYIHAKPVRRGLCQYAIEWLWSSALDWEQPGSGMLRIDRESVPRTDAG